MIALYKYSQEDNKEVFLKTVSREKAEGVKLFANYYETDKGETVYVINDLHITMEDDSIRPSF